MRGPKLHELLKGSPFAPRGNENGRAPMFRHIPVQDVLVLERVRASNVGHGSEVADGIRDLFAAESKRDAQKLASNVVLTGQDFFDLVTNCGSLGYVHEEGHRQDTPEGRGLSSNERVSLLYSKGGPDPSVLRKLRDGYREQRHLSWHTFTSNAERWHCFFYETRDIHGEPLTGQLHSKEDVGPHVHYASHLFHAVSAAEFVTWMKPGAKPPHDTHVRFRTSFTPENLAEFEEVSGDEPELGAADEGGPRET
jgi:hypothetical protein